MLQPLQWVRRIFPGLLISATIAMASTFISDHHGGPVLLYALLIGMAFHFLSKDSVAAPGIAFAGGTVLRVGVALLGARISAGEIADLGFMPVAMVVVGVTTTIILGALLSRVLRLSTALGVLTGGSVAICGASAALAISTVLPRTKDRETNTLFTIIAVTTLSTIAMILYPLIAHTLTLPDYAAGILLGGTIHDVAQVVAAGHLISSDAETVATYVKLLRVAMLMPVVLILSVFFLGRSGRAAMDRKLSVPLFLLGFAAFAIFNSFSLIPAQLGDTMSTVSRWCLVCAISALGMKTALQEMAGVGWRPLLLTVAETLYLLLFVLLVLKFAL